MSYILDALKKSSEERARVTGRDAKVEALPAAPRHETRAFRLPRGWIAALVLAGLTCLTLVAFVGEGADAPEPARPPISEPIAPLPTDAASASVRLDEAPAPPVVAASKPKPRNPATENAHDAPATAPAAPKLAAKPPAPEPAPAVAPRNLPAIVAAPAAARAPAAEGGEMPPDLLKQVLAIPVSAHIYSSKPAERMIIIDGQAVREGDKLSSGVTIEQITATGIAVSYKGYHANKPIH